MENEINLEDNTVQVSYKLNIVDYNKKASDAIITFLRNIIFSLVL